MVIKDEKRFCCVCLRLDSYEIVSDNPHSEQHDLDTRPYGEERYALTRSVHICPYCHYANFSVDSEIDNVDMKAVVNSESYKKLALSSISSDIKKFLLTAELYKQAQQYDASGYFYLNAAWICDDKGEFELAKTYRTLCIEQLERKPSADTVEMLCDALRRTENYKLAKKTAKKALRSLELSQNQKHCLKTEIALCGKACSDAVKFTIPKDNIFKRFFTKKSKID